jgi:hypothetical protein
LVVLDLDGNGGVLEGCVNGVDRDRVVGVGGIARNVNNDSQVATRLGKELLIDEGRNGLGKVNCVKEDISLGDLLVRT